MSRKHQEKRLQNFRDQARIRQNNWCWWCGCEMSNPPASQGRSKVLYTACTTEHLIPASKRKNISYYAQWNIVAACFRCNNQRNNYEMSVWLNICTERKHGHKRVRSSGSSYPGR